MDVEQTDKLAERNEEIDKLIKIIDIILSLSGNVNQQKFNSDMAAGVIDIDMSDDIAGLLMIVFTCLRKEANDAQESVKYRAYSAKIGEVEITVASVVEEVKKQKIELNFFITTPIVELMTLFKASFDEVRTGVTRFRVRENVAKRGIKRDSEGKAVGRLDKSRELTQNITQYGLNFHHIPLLQGITFAPERRTGVIDSLGPLSQALMLVMEDKYYNKLSSALQNSLQMLPMAMEIINCLKEAHSPGSVGGILKELGDILIMTTGRATQKFYFPLMLYYVMWRKFKETPFSWSFSGADMLKVFSKIAASGVLQFRMKSGGDKIKTAQVVFHAMFGTYLDDLDICEQITSNTGKWFQRKELNSVFLKRSSCPQISFTPIYFKYVLKRAQALLTKSLGNIAPLPTCRLSFSGFRKRGFTQELKASQSFSNDPIQLQYALKKTKDQVLKDIESIKILNAGTSWETLVNGNWVRSEFIASEGNRKFFGF